VSTHLIKRVENYNQTRLTSCRFRVGNRVGLALPNSMLHWLSLLKRSGSMLKILGQGM